MNQTKTAYIITLLIGCAREWRTVIWDSRSLVCFLRQDEAGLRFRHRQETAREMQQIHQGGGLSYAMEFKTLPVTSPTKDKLPLTQLDALTDFSVHIGHCRAAQYQERAESWSPAGETCSQSPPHNWTAPVLTPQQMEPMQINCTCLTPNERQSLIRTHSCVCHLLSASLFTGGHSDVALVLVNFINSYLVSQLGSPQIPLPTLL